MCAAGPMSLNVLGHLVQSCLSGHVREDGLQGILSEGYQLEKAQIALSVRKHIVLELTQQERSNKISVTAC